MDEKRMKENLQKIAEGRLPIPPELAFEVLQKMTTDSCELNFDSKSGELKSIKVKSYDTTIEGAVRAAFLGLHEADVRSSPRPGISVFLDDGDFKVVVDPRLDRSQRIQAADALYQENERLLQEEESEEASQ